MKCYRQTTLNLLFSIVLLVALVSCQSSTDGQGGKAATSKAQEIVDASIEAHGGKLFDKMAAGFDFRDRHYTILRENGAYVYTREFTDSLGQVRDVLSNDGFYREVNGRKVELTEEREKAYANSVNSVIYFALLPHGLNNTAVNKEYLGETSIKGKPYHKIKVTFDQEGGGSDHEDEYIYWIHPDNFTVDYLAYSFNVNDGGLRFRAAHNVRDIKGILFADYINYEPVSDTVALEKLDVAYENEGLKKLSDINLKNITVKTETI